MKTILFVIVFWGIQMACKESKGPSSSTNPISEVLLSDANGCGYLTTLDSKSYFLFDADNQAQQAVKSIMGMTGLPANFEIKAGDVENAVAVIMKNSNPPKRYIFYNQTFFHDLEQKVGSPFGPISVIAHEIGHHLAGHTLGKEGSRPLLELEADRFSGYILRKLKASLTEAQLVINNIAPDNGTATHPGKKARLAAIANGWMEADEQMAALNKNENISQITELKATHSISTAPQWAIALRNKELSKSELQTVNSPDLNTRQLLDGKTLVGVLKVGTKVRLLGQKGTFYEIECMINGALKRGFIAKSIYGKSTLVEN